MKIIDDRIVLFRMGCIIPGQVDPVISLCFKGLTVKGDILVGIGFWGFAGQEA
jgi:hypothetical protein